MNKKLKKQERLHSRKQIEELFSHGKHFYLFPFSVFYLHSEGERERPPQVLISVSKKKFRKATDRNKIKRLVREAYRLNKQPLLLSSSGHRKHLLVGLIYTAGTILSFAEIERKIILILQRLIEQDEQAAG